jgi:uncharacterized membrane protein
VENFDYVQFLSRWLHITAAVAAGGGAIFMKIALHPATETLPDDARARLREAVRARWAKVVHTSILILLVTGLFNFIVITKQFDLPRPYYHAVFGLKFLLAMGIFFLGSVLVGRGELAKKLRADAGKWLSVLVALLVVLLLASSMLKNLDHKLKSAPPTGQASSG